MVTSMTDLAAIQDDANAKVRKIREEAARAYIAAIGEMRTKLQEQSFRNNVVERLAMVQGSKGSSAQWLWEFDKIKALLEMGDGQVAQLAYCLANNDYISAGELRQSRMSGSGLENIIDFMARLSKSFQELEERRAQEDRASGVTSLSDGAR